ncbi:hypothetical protein CA13_00920 [Planctomycetes bacterium CA13]|uniref:Uncharacterized protein n=1 Tax=Novipirellula herctigrandis TaxID=2527986 RepID=A0A5C5YVB4_9BACT|nr:hypothetical protein CA13_00920 [Planctomycetes bacterium CA13]
MVTRSAFNPNPCDNHVIQRRTGVPFFRLLASRSPVPADHRRYHTPGDCCSAIGALLMIPLRPFGSQRRLFLNWDLVKLILLGNGQPSPKGPKAKRTVLGRLIHHGDSIGI